MSEHFYFVVRADLATGLQLAQLAHVATSVGALEPRATCGTFHVHHAADLEALRDRWLRASDRSYQIHGLRLAAFLEPALGDEMTAFAAWGDGSARVVDGLPRAFADGCG